MARPPAPVAQQPAGGPQASGGGLPVFLRGRNGAILAAGGTVALVALLGLFGKGKSAPAAADTSTSQAFDSGPYDQWAAWEQQYEDLQGRVGALENGQPNPNPVPVPAPVPKPPVPTPAPTPKPPTPRPPVRVGGPSSTSKQPAHPAPKPRTVTVERGDTLSGIAAKNHISMATLRKLNPVYWTNPKYRQGNRIFAGDRVKV